MSGFGRALVHLHAKIVKFMAEALERVALDENENHDAQNRVNAERENFAHRGIEPGIRAAENHGLRMRGAPKAVGDVNERDINISKDAEDGRKSGAALGLVHKTAEQDVGNVEEPEDEGGRKAGVPSPPNTPDGMGPDGAGDEANGAADHSDFRAGNAEPVPFEAARAEIGDVGKKRDGERRKHGNPGGQVHVEDALDKPHGALFRSDEKRGIAAENDKSDDKRGSGDVNFEGLHSSTRKSESSQEAARNTISNPARKVTQVRSSAGESPKSEEVASTAAMRSGARMGSKSSGRRSSRMRA